MLNHIVIMGRLTRDPELRRTASGIAVVSFTLASLTFVFGKGKLKNPIRKLKPLIVSSSPITAMRTLTSLTGTIVALIIPARLVFYGTETSVAMAEFGKLSGMALPLLFIPSTVIGSIALVLVPEISQSYYEKDEKRLRLSVERSINACGVISVLIIPVFIVCGKEIGAFLYDSEQAGIYLSVSAVVMLPMSVSMITNSLLNSVNKERKTLVNYVIGALIMLFVIWFAPKYMGIYSLILAYFLSFTVTAVLNAFALKKVLNEKTDCLKTLLLGCLSVAVSAVFGILLSGIIKNLPDILTILICAAAITAFNLALLAVTGVIDPKDLLLKKRKIVR